MDREELHATLNPEIERDEDILDLDQAIAFLKTTRPTMYRWIAQGKVQGFKAGRQWRFYRKDLRKFLEYEDPTIVGVDLDEIWDVSAALEKRIIRGPSEKVLLGEPISSSERNEEEVELDRLLDRIFTNAKQDLASDIHLDPAPANAMLRFRIDGVMHPILELPISVHRALVSRLKAMAKIDPTEGGVQYRRLASQPNKSGFETLVTILPSITGEKVTLRFLDKSQPLIGFEKLGLRESDRARLDRALHAPTGLLAFSGPTGSGNTTLMYSALARVASPEKVIMTVEDPVELRFPDMVQIGVNRKAGVSFSDALLGVLRADPDVVLVGELPDFETAKLTQKLATTGHLAMTRLHAKDAVGAIHRLIDLGIPPYDLANSLLMASSQRLIRLICPDCAEKITYPAEVVEAWLALAESEGLSKPKGKLVFKKGRGCEKCRGVGYKGRTGIYEILLMDPELEDLVMRNASIPELRKLAIQKGMTTMLADGMAKALEGITTVEEVLRVLGVSEMKRPQ